MCGSAANLRWLQTTVSYKRLKVKLDGLNSFQSGGGEGAGALQRAHGSKAEKYFSDPGSIAGRCGLHWTARM
jgi:hypothetical protein